jgi:hypothetical protein
MQPEQLYEGRYLRILWDEKSRTIAIDWKEATSTMTSEEFKADLTLFATHVESKKAAGILVDVSKFRHKMEPEVQPWRVKNISPRYSAAGVKRFAFLFPAGAQIPPMMNQSSPEEKFLTRAFDDVQRAEAWLTAG